MTSRRETNRATVEPLNFVWNDRDHTKQRTFCQWQSETPVLYLADVSLTETLQIRSLYTNIVSSLRFLVRTVPGLCCASG